MLVRDTTQQADGLLELTVETRGRRPCAGDRLALPLRDGGMALCELLSCIEEGRACARLVTASLASLCEIPRQVGLVGRATVWSGNLELPHVASGKVVAGLWYVPDSYGADPMNIALAATHGGLHVHWRRYPNSYKILAGAEQVGSPFASQEGVTMGEVLESAWYQRYLRHACHTGSVELSGRTLAQAQGLLSRLQEGGGVRETLDGTDGVVLVTCCDDRAVTSEVSLGTRGDGRPAELLARLLLGCAGLDLGQSGLLSA